MLYTINAKLSASQASLMKATNAGTASPTAPERFNFFPNMPDLLYLTWSGLDVGSSTVDVALHSFNFTIVDLTGKLTANNADLSATLDLPLMGGDADVEAIWTTNSTKAAGLWFTLDAHFLNWDTGKLTFHVLPW